MRILITGARGQLGQSLRRVLPEDWELIATDSKTLDITNAESVESMIAGFQPDALVNTAAYTNVDAAEHDIEKTFAINAYGVRNLACSARKHGARMIHFSSDYVFDGRKNTPYSAEDAPQPLNVYGRSKLAGEVLALAANSDTLIIRTAALFSEFGQNFVKTVAAQVRSGKTVSVVDDQVCCPTYAPDVARAVIAFIRDYPAVRGITHLTGSEALSWFAFAQKIALAVDASPALINARDSISTETARPAYSVLDNTQTSEHITLTPLERALVVSTTETSMI